MTTASHSNPAIRPKFRRNGSSSFYSDLRQAVDSYFEDRRISERGGVEIVLKIIFLVLLYLSSYYLLLSNSQSLIATLFFAIVFGISNVLIGFNIGHDAGHGALFASKKLNRFFAYSFNLVGINAYSWDITHNKIHHIYPNVADYDIEIHYQAPLLRVSPTEPLKFYHKFQVIYAVPYYLISTMLLVFVKEYQDMGLLPANKGRGQIRIRHSLREIGIFLVSKMIYYTIWIVIPLIVLNLSLSQFILGFVIVHVCMGMLTSAVLFTVHLVDEAPFAFVNEEHDIDDSWAEHVIKNTIDYSAKSRIANYLFGGLNTHAIHHLFPRVCHVHYRALTGILEQTAKKHGLNYRSVSMPEAIRSHIRFLKKMSVEQSTDV